MLVYMVPSEAVQNRYGQSEWKQKKKMTKIVKFGIEKFV